MQNSPPNPQQNPPNYQPYTPPYSQPFPPTYPPQPSYTQPLHPSPPHPSYSQPPPPAYPPYPPYPPYAHQDNTTALVLEAVCSVFGLYGIGWLFRGRVGVGIALLALGFVWMAFVLVALIFTAGIAGFCFVPLHLIFIVIDVLMLNSSLRHP